MKILILLLMSIGIIGCGNTIECKLVKEGEVKKVEYLQGNFSSRDKTIIYFIDGTSQVLFGQHSVPYKKIKLYDCAGDCINGGYEIKNLED